MRFRSVSIDNVAGLPDGLVELPREDVLAVAGPNGVGKSRLLLCLISTWIGDLPRARDIDRRSSVKVQIELTEEERDELRLLSIEIEGWEEHVPAEISTLEVTKTPRAGVQRDPERTGVLLRYALGQDAFLARVPSLDVVYLPPERRLESRQDPEVDMKALDPAVILQSAREARRFALTSSGKLDESEFEKFVSALCIAASLPEAPGVPAGAIDAPAEAWAEFKSAADQLLEPKELLGLSRARPDQLLIRLPDGGSHAIAELSSGERQALVILARLFRAGRSRTATIIDEPDLHLHPHLSARLLSSIRLLRPSQLIVATHSPFILDALAPNAILRLRRDGPPTFLASEADRIAVYRDAGFRASQLTQADLLVVTEGKSDVELLKAMEPSLARAAIQEAGGRAAVLGRVSALDHADIPIVGVVDRDVHGTPLPTEFAGKVVAWPYSDIEATIIADPASLQQMIDGQFVKPEFATVAALQQVLGDVVAGFRDNAIAEVAQRLLQERFPDPFPSPRADDPVARLHDAWMADRAKPFAEADFQSIQAEATSLVDSAESPLLYVRGKWAISAFAQRVSNFRDGGSLLLSTVTVMATPPDGARAVIDAIRGKLGVEPLTPVAAATE